jgi:glycosyltransferase involved in cell wall biosynthesis
MNRALEMARGDLVAFAAADDVIYPQFLERAASLIEKFPVAAFVSGRTDIISVEGNRVGHLNASMPLDRPGYLDPRESARALMRIDSWFTGNVTLFRREPLLASGGFPEDLSAFTDGYVSRLLAVKHGVCFAPEIWGAWRRMEDGLAWSETEDFELLTRRMAAVERRMRESGAPFEPGYFHRWKNRSLFGARRFALANRRRRARERGLPAFVAACLREFLGSAVLFLRLRPWDVGSVLRRWLFQKNL